jgi:NAD+ kinase
MTSTPPSTPPSARAVSRAAVVAHLRHDGVDDAVKRLEDVARRHGVELLEAGEEGPDAVDLAVVLGGDGTMLRALNRYLGSGVPVVGVNLGKVGFLTAMPVEQMDTGLARVFAGDYEVYELPTLACEIEGERRYAVNDVVGHSSSVGRMVEIAWEVGGEPLGSLRCDGVVCATPSGSTAYNLSSGGPVLVWGLEAMAVTFVAPHSLQARPLVVPKGREVVVRNVKDDVGLAVTLDGHVFTELGEGGELRVLLDDARTRLATLPERTFFARFRQTFAS